MGGIIFGALALIAGQVFAALVAIVVMRPLQQYFALREVLADTSQYGVGTVYSTVLRKGADKEWCGRCEVVGVVRGKVTVRLLDENGRWLPYTKAASCREFIDFHPTIEDPTRMAQQEANG